MLSRLYHITTRLMYFSETILIFNILFTSSVFELYHKNICYSFSFTTDLRCGV